MKNKIFIAIFMGSILLASCTKSLNETPQGVISTSDLNTPANVDGQVIACYSSLGNDHYYTPWSSMWAYGSIRGGDAYKGGGGPGDIADFNALEVFNQVNPTWGTIDQAWYQLYVGIAYCNSAINLINGMTLAEYPNKVQRTAEVRFLRGHFYFLLKIMFNHIPWIDETIPRTAYGTISNVALTSDALWTNIENDFAFASANLPLTQTDLGRATKGAAQAYWAKALIYHAYTQDASNNVTGIDQTKMAMVNTLCDSVINSGVYSLTADFADNFLPQFRNNSEAVFAIQYSKNDGTPQGRVDEDHCLDYGMVVQYGCCGFHVPSDNLINAFKTDGNGLPEFNTFNDTDIVATGNYQSNTFDPRIDHTCALIGHPYKYQTDLIYDSAFARQPQSYGYNLSLKEVVNYRDPSFQRFPPFMSSSKNWSVIRYADVLLMKAEALIQTNQQALALPLINQIRQRAANSTALLVQADGTPTSNYKIGTYIDGTNCNWTQAYALQALQFERRLEFAMEGYRFFDLVRWGIAASYINSYFAVESTRTPHLTGASFTPNRDEYLPISQNQLNFSQGVYKQNPGW